MAAAGGRVGRFAQGEINRLQNPREISIDVVVPEPEDAEAGLRERAVTIQVAHSMIVEVVLAAVDFDDNAMLKTDKIHYEALARRLSAEVKVTATP